jgi:cation transport ATPase
VLKSIADLFDVTVDYLITAEHPQKAAPDEEDPAVVQEKAKKRKRMHVMVTGMSVLLVWLVAAIIFIPIDIAAPDAKAHWLSFAYAIPVSMLVWLVFNATWFNRRRNYLIISLMMWSALGSVVLTLMLVGYNVWQLMILGVLGQVIIATWSKMQYQKKKK